MDNPGADSLMDNVRKINELAKRARSNKPGVEEYLRSVNSDPVTEWFMELLRDKNDELAKENHRADRLVRALRRWHRAKAAATLETPASQADVQLIAAMRGLGIIHD
jgi:hypothetical protein